MDKEHKKVSVPNVTHKYLNSENIGNIEQLICRTKLAIFISSNHYNLIIIDNKNRCSESYKNNKNPTQDGIQKSKKDF